MEKTEKSRLNDWNTYGGLIWVRMPSKDIRTSSGVQFRGVYMTTAEYKSMLKKKEKTEK